MKDHLGESKSWSFLSTYSAKRADAFNQAELYLSSLFNYSLIGQTDYERTPQDQSFGHWHLPWCDVGLSRCLKVLMIRNVGDIADGPRALALCAAYSPMWS